jgi:hypothetical protein
MIHDVTDSNPGLRWRLWTSSDENPVPEVPARPLSPKWRRIWMLAFFAGVPAICAGLLTYAFITDDTPGPAGQSGSSVPCTRSASFVSHDPAMDPTGSGAEAVRAGGFLVTSDGAGGSCVYNDG